MTERLPKTDKNDEDEGLDWARIAGFTLVVAIHAAALLLLLAPATPPQAQPDIGASVDISSKAMNPPQYPEIGRASCRERV